MEYCCRVDALSAVTVLHNEAMMTASSFLRVPVGEVQIVSRTAEGRDHAFFAVRTIENMQIGGEGQGIERTQ